MEGVREPLTHVYVDDASSHRRLWQQSGRTARSEGTIQGAGDSQKREVRGPEMLTPVSMGRTGTRDPRAMVSREKRRLVPRGPGRSQLSLLFLPSAWHLV